MLWFFVIYFLFHVLGIIFYVAKHEMLWLRLRRKLWWFYLESYLVAPARSLISLPLCLPCIRRSLLINRRVSATHKSREEYTRSIFKGGFPNPHRRENVWLLQLQLRGLHAKFVALSTCRYLDRNYIRLRSHSCQSCSFILHLTLAEGSRKFIISWGRTESEQSYLT